MSPSFPGSKNKPGKNPVTTELCYVLDAGLLLGLFFVPEDGGDIFLLNVGWLSTDYMALNPRRENSS
jgi:hypothetical protein